MMSEKKIVRAILFAALFSVLSCDKTREQPNEDNSQNQSSITLETEASKVSTLDSGGGNVSVSFTASGPWSASVINTRADSWCEVSPSSGPAGKGTVSIIVKPNENPDERNATIQLTCGTVSCAIVITQKQKDAITVTPSKHEFGAEGGNFEIVVSANIDYNYEIESSCKEWISASDTKVLNSQTRSFIVASNENVEKREGAITVKSALGQETVHVYQEGSKPSLILTKSDYTISSAGETIQVEIKSNVSVSAAIQEGCDWIYEVSTKAMSTNTYCFAVSANEDYDGRSAQILFSNEEYGLSETVSVSQLQKDALVLAKEEYVFGIESGHLEIEIITNCDITVEIPQEDSWVFLTGTKGLREGTLCFSLLANYDEEERISTITLHAGTLSQEIRIRQEGIGSIKKRQRDALIAFYQATNGDNWKSATNWCSDKPLSEWEGIAVNSKGYVTQILLSSNNLEGVIPSEISKLEKLNYISLLGNQISGSIPPELANLSNLSSIVLQGNQLTGPIPPEIGKLANLTFLNLSMNSLSGPIPSELGNLSSLTDLRLNNNQLSGEIPESFNNLTKLKRIPWLYYNNLSGKIPELFLSFPDWKDNWLQVMIGNRFFLEENPVPGPSFSIVDINGVNYSSEEEYPKHQLTALPTWGTQWAYTIYGLIPRLQEAYRKYKESGLWILGQALYENSVEDVRQYVAKSGIDWPNFLPSASNKFDGSSDWSGDYSRGYPDEERPYITFVDNQGFIRFSTLLQKDINCYDEAFAFLDEFFGPVDRYCSTDFSQDGQVKQLQQATEGNGIDIVLMGDAFSDRMVASGEYDRTMNQMMEAIFAEEPYKSFRHLFNVYSVTAVSVNEDYSEGASTVFSTYHGEGSHVGGDNDRVREYATLAVGNERIGHALNIVAMNSIQHGGTCYMFSMPDNDYGDGMSISYCPVYDKGYRFECVIRHEAGGHGLAKLADEYAYESSGSIPETEMEEYKRMFAYGWWKNADFTSDPTQVKWAKFISDSRYDADKIGVFEGALTYWSGAYRPTENSIMNDDTGGYNAPSREAIFYTIHKLAYGSNWEYNYEDFVSYDSLSRKPLNITRKNYVQKKESHRTGARPVFMGFIQ